jgi:hypothetical protein
MTVKAALIRAEKLRRLMLLRLEIAQLRAKR